MKPDIDDDDDDKFECFVCGKLEDYDNGHTVYFAESGAQRVCDDCYDNID